MFFIILWIQLPTKRILLPVSTHTKSQFITANAAVTAATAAPIWNHILVQAQRLTNPPSTNNV
jgi:hypothetical protein